MASQTIRQDDTSALRQLKCAALGFVAGIALASFSAFLYVQELKLQVVDDIQYERNFIVAAYKPALEKLTAEERNEWAAGLPERELNVMCKYLSSLCEQ